MTKTRTYDAIIIGAGITGCRPALELARRDQGLSGRSSAIIKRRMNPWVTANVLAVLKAAGRR